MSTLFKHVQQHKYEDRRGFLTDLVLIRDNFVAFKGPGPENNRAAHVIATICKNFFDNFSGLVGLRVCGFVGLWVCGFVDLCVFRFVCWLVGWLVCGLVLSLKRVARPLDGHLICMTKHCRV